MHVVVFVCVHVFVHLYINNDYICMHVCTCTYCIYMFVVTSSNVNCICVQVEALRTKVSNLETELKSSTSINRHVQQQLEEVKASQANNEQRLKEDKEHLLTQVDYTLHVGVGISIELGYFI